MARIPRAQSLKTLPSHLGHSLSPSARSSFCLSSSSSQRTPLRCLSTTSSQSGKNTDWVRRKLWKGEAPGPADPYTTRPSTDISDDAAISSSNLPEEARDVNLRRADKPIPYPLRESRLVLPPQRSEAATQAAVQAQDALYVAAESIDDLEQVPDMKTWWDQPGHWGSESVFRGFGVSAGDKTTDPALVEVQLRRAVVEALALQSAGHDVFAEWSTRRWSDGGREQMNEALAVGIQVTDGKASLQGEGATVSEGLMGEVEDGAAEVITADEAKEMVKGWTPEWKDIVLDEQLKFVIRKRLYQLTGQLVPDAKLAAAQTVRHLLTLAAKPPKPKTLHEVLETKEDLASLSNVSVHPQRITPVHREVKLGRWKVIEEELKKRELPVTGHKGLDGRKEKAWSFPKRRMRRGMGSADDISWR